MSEPVLTYAEVAATLTLDELYSVLGSCWQNKMAIAILTSKGETHLGSVSLSQRLAVCDAMIPVIGKEIALRESQAD